MPVPVDITLVTSSVLNHPAEETTTLIPLLRKMGFVVESTVWNDPSVDWSQSRVCVVRSTWDYYAHRIAFLAWASHVNRVSTLWNTAETLGWNSHKSYLVDLESNGIPIVPTVLVKKNSPSSLNDIMHERGWQNVILKPAVSLGAIGVLPVTGGDHAGQVHLEELLASGDVLVQPFVESVKQSGETSVIFIDGKIAHMVRKIPAAGDFRVQEQFGGRFEQVSPDERIMAIALEALDTVEEPLLYARVDFVQIDGKPHIMEVELIEPSLYLETVPTSISLFARAIAARLP